MVQARNNVFGFQSGERVVAFIDGVNFSSTCRMLDINCDYGKVRNLLNQSGQLVRAVFHSAFDPDKDDAPERRLFDWLDYNGYTVRLKESRTYQDPHTGARKIRASIAVPLTCDAFDAAQHADHIVLFSGDGDYVDLVAGLQKRGVRVSVVSSLKTEVPAVNDMLRRQADRFIELDEIGDFIHKSTQVSAPPPPVQLHAARPAA